MNFVKNFIYLGAGRLSLPLINYYDEYLLKNKYDKNMFLSEKEAMKSEKIRLKL